MEIWKDILNYEGLYQVSNYGNIKSLNRINRNGKTVHEKILSQAKSTSGYLQVNLSKDNEVKIFQVHRLVAVAFIDNPDNKPQVDHIDNNKHNNHVKNLRWVTGKENMENVITKITLSNRPRRKLSEEHKEKISNGLKGRVVSEYTREKLSKASKGRKVKEESIIKRVEKCKKPVICLNDNKKYGSVKEASIYYDIDQSGIIRVCKEKQHTVKGLRFSYYIDAR